MPPALRVPPPRRAARKESGHMHPRGDHRHSRSLSLFHFYFYFYLALLHTYSLHSTTNSSLRRMTMRRWQ
ncbi:hypothetical protein PCANC_04810 [Puccinia coronata f. sp. avenae]|uniref:Uncharacterized protein n=1 Tax=Puccinia coronata f. sp. avenae TaxID=200324 RepID=A0A2N5VCJ1_9BASI|nr:hypothetical protein PCASD_04112 [Puccinia coronata f. sp. avenae]PLW56498.1 hypothetical protein PCANC_04810 [Puccinia coronata f. sp. avenae]